MLALEMAIHHDGKVQFGGIRTSELREYFPPNIRVSGLEWLDKSKPTAIYSHFDARGNVEMIRVINEQRWTLRLSYDKWNRRLTCARIIEPNLSALEWLDYLIPEPLIVEYMSTIRPVIMCNPEAVMSDIEHIRINGLNYSACDFQCGQNLCKLDDAFQDASFDMASPVVKFKPILKSIEANRMVLYASQNLEDYYTSNKCKLNNCIQDGKLCDIRQFNPMGIKIRARMERVA